MQTAAGGSQRPRSGTRRTVGGVGNGGSGGSDGSDGSDGSGGSGGGGVGGSGGGGGGVAQRPPSHTASASHVA